MNAFTRLRAGVAGYLLLSVLAGLLPLAVNHGDGVGAVGTVASILLAVGHRFPSTRGAGAGLSLLAIGIATGHRDSAAVLATATGVAVLCLLLLRWPTGGAETGPVLRALALELPLGVAAAALVAAASTGRLPVVVGLLAAAGVLAALVGSSLTRRR